MKSILFVCTGNICRSPTADAIFRKLVKENGLKIEVDSAGTHGYHIGDPPDPRTIKTALQYGIDMSPLRARKLELSDFSKFDTLIAMDNSHLSMMTKIAPPSTHHKIELFLNSLEGFENQDTPDPYYGDIRGFDDVFHLINKGCTALLKKIQQI